MDQGQGYGHSYTLPLGVVPHITGMQQYAAPPPFPYHAPHYSYPAGPARSAVILSQGNGLGLASGFFNPWEAPPAPVPPPADNDLQKRIDKLVEYACKNGPQFEALMKDKQKENPLYAFLFNGEGHDYYCYKLWQTLNPVVSNPPPAAVPSYNPALTALNSVQNVSPAPGLACLNPSFKPAIACPLKPALSAAPPVAPPSASFASGCYEHHPQPFYDQFQHESYGGVNYPHASVVFPSGSLPLEVAAELKGLLDNLTGTKESIKGAKMWFMQRAAYGPALVEVLKDRVFSMDDVERQLHIIYLANDILFNSLQHRTNPKELDPEALAFKPALGTMLASIYHNPKDMATNHDRLQKILQFWGAKEVYDMDTIDTLEGEMVAGPPPPVATTIKLLPAVQFQYGSQWQSDQASQPSSIAPPQQTDQPPQTDQPQQPFPAPSQFYGAGVQFNPSNPAQQFLATSIPSLYPSMAGPPYLAPLPPPVPIQTPPLAALPTPVRPADQNAYPLFPPGLIPGMVRKMQIGSGVPYSPLSPLDIPTVIPASIASDSYVLERVTKFFKEIGEVDPLEGQVTANDAKNHDDEGDEDGDREGGARIPPNSMQVDPETGTTPDGSLEHCGLGSCANPNETSQYDDVYSSYRKQRSTNYHTTLSARLAAR